MGDPTFDNLVLIDGFFGKRKHLHEKEKGQHEFTNDVKADVRHKMGLRQWSQKPLPRTLKILEGCLSSKRKI